MRTITLLVAMVLCCQAGSVLGQDRPVSLLPAGGADQVAPAMLAAPAFTATGEGGAASRFWAEADYVLWWLKPVCLKPPTLGTGGVPGTPGSEIVQGDHKFEFPGASGLQTRLGAWLTDDGILGIEAGGFVLEKVAAGEPFTTTNGSPASFLVFQTPANANAILPFTIPGVVTGSSTAVGTSHLWGVDGALTTHFVSRRGAWTLSADWLAGWRYLQIEDRVVVINRQALVAAPSVSATGEADFATRNQFIGGQIGSRLGVAHGPLALELTTKLALGETHLVSAVVGGPLLSGTSVMPPLVPGPLLALPSNIGQSASDRISVVPELDLRLRWQVMDHVTLTLGYSLLYWNKVLCPGDQMDPHVNTTQLPLSMVPPTGARAPAPLFVFTDAFAHGLEAGLGFDF